jgi:hypothetical protein
MATRENGKKRGGRPAETRRAPDVSARDRWRAAIQGGEFEMNE